MLRFVSLLVLSSFVEATDKCPQGIQNLKFIISPDGWRSECQTSVKDTVSKLGKCDDSYINDIRSHCEGCAGLGDQWYADKTCWYVKAMNLTCSAITCESLGEVFHTINEGCCQESRLLEEPQCPPKIEALKSQVGEEVFDAGFAAAKESIMPGLENCDENTMPLAFKATCEKCPSLGDRWAEDAACVFIIGAEMSCDSQTCESITQTLKPVLENCGAKSDNVSNSETRTESPRSGRRMEDLSRRQNARQWVQQQLSTPVHQLPSNPAVLNHFMNVVNGVYDEKADDPDWAIHRSELIEARNILLNNYENQPKLTWALEDGKSWLKSKMNSLLLGNQAVGGKNQAAKFINVLHDEFSKQWITMLVNGDFDAHEMALKAAKNYLLKYDDGLLSNDQLVGKEWLLTQIHTLLARRLLQGDLHV